MKRYDRIVDLIVKAYRTATKETALLAIHAYEQLGKKGVDERWLKFGNLIEKAIANRHQYNTR